MLAEPDPTAQAAVVGHVEWVTFAVLDAAPADGAIVHAREFFDEAAGGGAVAAVNLARITGRAVPFACAVGSDGAGAQALERLRTWGVDVRAEVVDAPQRRALTWLLPGERSIVILGERHVPERGLTARGVFFTGGSAAALREARRSPLLVATPRAGPVLQGTQLDVLVGSATDPSEQLAIDPPPRLRVWTQGERGGHYAYDDGRTGRWDPVPLPGPPVDSYGCGDTFAAALTLLLARGAELDAALAFAARCGAAVLCGRGPYGSELPTCAS